MNSKIETLYLSSFRGPFPYDDCRWLAERVHVKESVLIPDLDWFFGTVAGYASSASRLTHRTPKDLRDAKQLMSKGFYDYFPKYAEYRDLICTENTPALYDRMRIAEELRVQLLQLLENIPAGR